MSDELVTISLRIPKKMNKELEAEAKRKQYATKTEVVREAIRNRLYYEAFAPLRGALKGKVKTDGKTMGEWRREMWQEYLKKAGGDPYKASELQRKDEAEAIKGLKL